MTAGNRVRAARLHEWPLVVFTSLAILGAALIVTALASLTPGRVASDAPAAALRGVLLLAAGLVVSLAHLGRPMRAPLAIRRLGGSRLSAEVVLAGATLALGMAVLALPSSRAAVAAAGAAAAALLVSLGLVYSLPGALAWRGAVVWTPLVTGLALAATITAAIPLSPDAWRPVAAALLAADLVILWLRARRLSSLPAGCSPAYPALFEERGILLSLRLALVDLLPLLLFVLRPGAAAAVLAVGIFVDRVQFYALASRHTSEGEIAMAEEVIRSLRA